MAQVSHVNIGNLMAPQATFKNAAGVDTDPTNLTVKQQDPAGTRNHPLHRPHMRLNAGTTPCSEDRGGDLQAEPGRPRFAERAGGCSTSPAPALSRPPKNSCMSPTRPSSRTRQRSSAPAPGDVAEARDWLQHTQQEMPDGLEIVRVINDVSDRIHYEAAREFKAAGGEPAGAPVPHRERQPPDPWYVDGQYMGDRNIWSRTVSVGDLAATPTLVRILDTDWTTSARNRRGRGHHRCTP